jgi:hypothetical protein
MDVGWRVLDNQTYIRSKGAMHNNQRLRERCGSITATDY